MYDNCNFFKRKPENLTNFQKQFSFFYTLVNTLIKTYIYDKGTKKKTSFTIFLIKRICMLLIYYANSSRYFIMLHS